MPKRTSSSNKPNKKSKARTLPVRRRSIKSQYMCKVLDSPVKSASDKKLYRTIKLSNNLIALLISDQSAVTSDSESSCSDSDESEDELSSCSIESDASDHSMTSLHSVNEKKSSSKLAAASLTVGVGSFSDPHDVQGLAHFLEHMVFMGSKAFPSENDFEAFVKRKGGSSNAHTGMENTTFYFEVKESSLEETLFKFAQFFIEPLLKQEAMTRERKAVNSEFQMATQSNEDRVEQLLLSLARDGHPARTFSWGNEVSLQKNITDEVLHNHLHTFRVRHYSSNRMTLALQSKKSLDELQKMVVNILSNVPNNNLEALNFKEFADESSFDTEKFKKIYYMKPIGNIFKVYLTWSMPSLLSIYRYKPHTYVSWILGYEGTGSLLAYLRKKLWAISIEAGNSEADSEHNTLYCLFGVTMVLTEDGMRNLEHIFHAVFAYLELIRRKGVNEKMFNDIKLLDEIGFQYAQEVDAVDNVEDISENMQLYAPKDYLTGSELMFEYSSDYIFQVLDRLNAESVNIIVLDSTLNDDVYNEVEPWFSTKYFSRDIPIQWIEAWKSIQIYPEFELPNVSNFLTTDFSIMQIPEDIPVMPVQVHCDAILGIWHKFDNIFKLPKAHMYFYFITPLVQYSAKHAALVDLYVYILKHVLVETLYPAVAAHLNYTIYAATKGFIVKVDGFNEKLPMLFNLIIQTMNTLLSKFTPEIFQIIKEQQLKNYHNYFIKPARLIKDLRSSALRQMFWSSLDRFAALKEISYVDMQYFSKDILKSMKIKCLVQGNMSDLIAKQVINNTISPLGLEKLPHSAKPLVRVVQIPEGERIICMSSLNKDDVNSVVMNYYQVGKLNMVDYAILELLMAIMEEPIFDVLRTKEQLGYDVRCDMSDFFGVLGFSVTVHYQADKFEPQYINQRIEAFLTDFKQILLKLSPADYADFQDSLIRIKQCPDVDLSQEVSRNWSEITSGEYIFDRLYKEVEFIKNTTLDVIIKWFDEHTVGGASFRKVSFQVLGHKPSEDKSSHLDKVTELVLASTDSCLDEKTEYDTNLESYLVNLEADKTNLYITNVEKFKNDLYLYPIFKTKLT